MIYFVQEFHLYSPLLSKKCCINEYSAGSVSMFFIKPLGAYPKNVVTSVTFQLTISKYKRINIIVNILHLSTCIIDFSDKLQGLYLHLKIKTCLLIQFK